jgi:hypothetical protein
MWRATLLASILLPTIPLDPPTSFTSDSIYYPYSSVNWAPSSYSGDDTFFDAIEPSALIDKAVAPSGEVN